MAEAANRSGRSLADVRLLGASKQVDPDRILKAIQLGVEDIGENRVKEAETKFKTLAPLRLAATWAKRSTTTKGVAGETLGGMTRLEQGNSGFRRWHM